MNDEITRHSTVSALVDAWTLSKAELEEGFRLVKAAEDRLNHFFDGGSLWLRFPERVDFSEPDRILGKWHASIFGAFIDRMQLRQVLSLKKIEELDKQIENGVDLPPITTEALLSIARAARDSMGEMLTEKVHEVYDWLRPEGCRLTKYKTNQKSNRQGVGKKVIIPWAVERGYSRIGGYSATHYKQDHLRALDQVFRLLDGKRVNAEEGDDLLSVIRKCTPASPCAESPYFRVRCFQNQNLHVEFLRQDLLGRFNVIAGGNRITEETIGG